jgi:hypothetical protein
LTTALAVGAAFLVVPAANADESNGIDVVLTPKNGISSSDTGWRGFQRRSMRFTIDVTDIGDLNDDGLSVFVSVPYGIGAFSGDRWDCWDVEGGLRCEIGDLVVPGESWPTLTIDGGTSEGYVRDSVDVYAESTHGDAHAGVPFRIGN